MEEKGLPEFGGDVRLPQSESARFQSEVVWPAIDRKWGSEFAQAVPGSTLRQEIPLKDDIGVSWCEINLSSFVDDDGDPVISASLSVYRSCDELLESLQQAHMADELKAAGNISRLKRKKLVRRMKTNLQQPAMQPERK